jgi:hypothetical protein
MNDLNSLKSASSSRASSALANTPANNVANAGVLSRSEREVLARTDRRAFNEATSKAVVHELRSANSALANEMADLIESGQVKIQVTALGKNSRGIARQGRYTPGDPRYENIIEIDMEYALHGRTTDRNLAGTAAHEITHWRQRNDPSYYQRLSVGRLGNEATKQHELDAHLVQRLVDPDAFRRKDPVTNLRTGRPLTTAEITDNINTKISCGYTGLDGTADISTLR